MLIYFIIKLQNQQSTTMVLLWHEEQSPLETEYLQSLKIGRVTV